MGRSAQEIESVLQTPGQMDERVFGHIAKDTLETYRNTAYSRSTQLIESHIGRLAGR
jgi:hypothetical protein